jgi:hypothetical protein
LKRYLMSPMPARTAFLQDAAGEHAEQQVLLSPPSSSMIPWYIYLADRFACPERPAKMPPGRTSCRLR